MIRINLLPVRQMKKRLRNRNEAIAFLASLVVLLALLVMASWSMDQKVSSLQTNIKNLNDKKAKYNVILNEIKQLEQDKQKLTAKIDVIKRLKSTSQITVRLLDEIARATPPDSIWLQSLKQSGSAVDLAGIALDNTRLADYMDRLTASPYFPSATLGKSSLTTIAGQDLKSFTLRLEIKNPESDKAQQANQDKVQ
ncbi:MAG: pilus assembly protein PilN [Desulfurivibrio sp.]|nr:MAG: pilus assembly protein PilN [Desulfurivibrio sp.]